MVGFLQTCYYSYPATPLANYTPPEGAFPAAVYPTYTAAGVWSYFSLDSGVAVIHLTPTTDNQLLFMERPGNREADVRTCWHTCPAEMLLRADHGPKLVLLNLRGVTGLWIKTFHCSNLAGSKQLPAMRLFQSQLQGHHILGSWAPLIGARDED